MSLGLVPLAIAAIGASYAALVLRGWRRRDNLMFGLLALTDALMVAWRGANVLTGGSIIAASVLVPCMLGTVVLALLTLEFVTAFPRRPAMSPRWRAAMLAWARSARAVVRRRDTGNYSTRPTSYRRWCSLGPAPCWCSCSARVPPHQRDAGW